MVEIFVSCAIHTEKQVLRELEEVKPFLLDSNGNFYSGPYEILELIPGGIRLNIDLIAALQLNFWLKTANRILIRLTQFRAGSWPEIKKHLQKVDLKSWLKDQPFQLQIDAERCKVSNEKYLRKVCLEVWKSVEEASQKLFLRGQNDHWTLSLDSSGEHLHRRGVRTKIGEAPLRETLAALTLRHLCNGFSRTQLGATALLDPMAGSGTFLIEARDLHRPVRSRSFSFLEWPRTPALLKSPQFWQNYPGSFTESSVFGSYHSIDVEPRMKALNEEQGLNFHLGKFKEISRQSLGLSGSQPLWLVSNPPYGRRLENLDWVPEFWTWWNQIQPERAAIWIPRDLKETFMGPALIAPAREIRAINGGISCEILFFGL